jgi:hypothetical protein
MKGVMLRLWGVWDWFYFCFNRMQYVSKEDNIFRIVRKKHTGPPLKTHSGEWIRPGDEIIKIHLYNYGLAKQVVQYHTEVSLALYLKKYMKESLVGLCEYINELPDNQNIKAIIGTSMLNRGADRLGFCLHDVQRSIFYWLKGFMYRFIYIMVHPYGMKYLKKNGYRLKSKHLVMSVNELNDLYLRRES